MVDDLHLLPLEGIVSETAGILKIRLDLLMIKGKWMSSIPKRWSSR